MIVNDSDFRPAITYIIQGFVGGATDGDKEIAIDGVAVDTLRR